MAAIAPTRAESGDKAVTTAWHMGHPARRAGGAGCAEGSVGPPGHGARTVALGPATTAPKAKTTGQTHVVHPVNSCAKQKERIDADALDAVTSEVIGIRRLLFGLLEERESAGQHRCCGRAGGRRQLGAALGDSLRERVSQAVETARLANSVLEGTGRTRKPPGSWPISSTCSSSTHGAQRGCGSSCSPNHRPCSSLRGKGMI